MNICKKCKSSFTPQKGLINYCSIKCKQSRTPSEETKKKIQSALKNKTDNNMTIQRKANEVKYYLSPTNCGHCSTPLPYQKRGNKFCSTSCAASVNNIGRVRTDKSKKIISDKMKLFLKENPEALEHFLSSTNIDGYRGPRKSNIYFNVCNACNTKFTSREPDRKYCSQYCSSHDLCGYKPRSGRGKKGWYKGYWCASSYELAYVYWNIENKINFKPYKGFFNYIGEDGKNHKYFPDFIEGNKIIEIKGQHVETVNIKKKAVMDKGIDIVVLYQKDIKHMIDLCKVNFGRKYWEALYEK